jgi:predicted secreted hydrolase
MDGRPYGVFVSALCLSGVLLSLLLPAAAAPEEWRQAMVPREWQFPRDHGAHPAYRTEWWYFTGNLKDEHENAFGYELAFFRQGIRLEADKSANPWSLRDLYLAHLAVTDAAKKRFVFDEAVSRTGPGLAGARENGLDVRLLGWSAGMQGGAILLRARGKEAWLMLKLTAQKPPVLNGERGLSRKGPLPGQASYYSTCARLLTTGLLGTSTSGAPVAVNGTSWFDHEFGSNELSAGQTGWDWFGLHLSDGKDLMLYFIRRNDGANERESSGTIVDRRGKSRHLPLSAIKLETLSRWKSPKSSAVYPSRWRICIPDEGLDILVSPLLSDQELATARSTGVIYWEGAVEGVGTSEGRKATCLGYAELTGYARGLGGLF